MTEHTQRYQVGGDHYARHRIQPWDIIREYGLNFWAGNALKYLLRKKPGVSRLEDLQKCRHYLDELIAQEQADIDAAQRARAGIAAARSAISGRLTDEPNTEPLGHREPGWGNLADEA